MNTNQHQTSTLYSMFLRFPKLAMLLAACLPMYGQTQITTVEQLAALNASKASLAGSYVLMRDLTLTNWTPIGGNDSNDGQGFSGTFDGNGHTITITGFGTSSDYSRVGLFGVIEKKGVVKNLCVTGTVSYANNHTFLCIGGIAGENWGHVTCCASKMEIQGSNSPVKKTEKAKKTGGISVLVFPGGAYGGCIVGVNFGTINNCYSTGSIRISRDGPDMMIGSAAYAGGIAALLGMEGGRLGQAWTGFVLNCYSAASVVSSNSVRGCHSGGLIAFVNNLTAGALCCVALNETIEAQAGSLVFAEPVARTTLFSYGLATNFYRNDIAIRKFKAGKEQKLGKYPFPERQSVALAVTQEQSWWRYPEGLTEKQRRSQFGFSFGETEQSPWVWDSVAKRPILYWEKTKRN